MDTLFIIVTAVLMLTTWTVAHTADRTPRSYSGGAS